MERAADSIGTYLAIHLGLDQDRREILSYGALALLQNGASLLLMIVLAAVLGLLPHALVALAAAGVMRHASGGVHLNTPLRCVLATSTAFVISGAVGKALTSPLALQPAYVQVGVVLLLAAAGMAAVLRYAPVEAENRPLSASHRAKLRRLSIRLGVVMVAVLGFGSMIGAWWALPALTGFLTQCSTLTPTGHKAANSLDQFLRFL